MSRHRRRMRLRDGPEWFTEQLRQKIAVRLQIEPNRIRYGPLPDGQLGRLGTAGDHWHIFYRDSWRELPWHCEGPQWVTRAMMRKWHGLANDDNNEEPTT